MPEEEVAVVSHYFDKINVAAINMLNGTLNVGDTIHIKGHTTDCTATIESMQIEHKIVNTVNKGDSVGIKISNKAREHDKIFKVTP